MTLITKEKGIAMAKNLGVAEVKKSFSTVISRVSLQVEHFVIEKKGKPVAALVPVQDLQKIADVVRKKPNKGLLAAIGAWEDFPDLEKTIDAIYGQRKKSKDRNVKGLV